jgi:hypothetical protein
MGTWLKAHGYSASATAAIIGNSDVETGGKFDPGISNPEGTAYETTNGRSA